MSRPRLYAHRGAAVEYPENTLPSFRRALELGADALEMDVHMTSDGHVVVSHDPSGERMAGVRAAIRDTPLAALREWNVGARFTGRDLHGERFRMPTLEEVLAELPPVPINIDIKQWDPPIVDAVLALLRRHRAEARTTLASFRLRTLLAVRARGFAGVTALAQPEVAALVFAPGGLYRLAPLTGTAAQLPVRAGPLRFDTRRVIDKCHRLGMRIDFWTINDPAEAERLLDLGADGIMTDDPAAIVPVFSRRS
ncbi:MAG TPA: glycerophosphodiester phosphodiesterase [Kofleriaceae bacterium]|nr:glycerophosphodiester phosphodiesterase [Kofleriaceae bacterium]